MGYTSVANREEAVAAANALLADLPVASSASAVDQLLLRYPLIVDQIAAEAGIVEPRVCARAFAQAGGDVARAVSLVRAWSATLQRLAHVRTRVAEWRPLRRITPAFVEPRGGQFLGASRDYAPRLLDFSEAPAAGASAHPNGTTALAGVPPSANGTASVNANANASVPSAGKLHPAAQKPIDAAGLGFAFDALQQEGLVAESERSEARDLTRGTPSRLSRGPFSQLLSRAETGALTALAYAGIRGHGQRQDPTLVELRCGSVPLRLTRPDSGLPFVVGSFVATSAEIALYAIHESGEADPGFTRGFGATPGRVERRAIAAAMLDAATARAGVSAAEKREPYDDREFIGIVVDGQESAGFVEHLKLPHYVTFASDLERVRAARDPERPHAARDPEGPHAARAGATT
jgi:alpha-D-ribose 1-methylphosphonate 5-triphosphate synthase subunit PhnI